MSRKDPPSRRPALPAHGMNGPLPSHRDEEVDMDLVMVSLIREAKIERLRGEVLAGAYVPNVQRLARRLVPVMCVAN